MKRLILTSIFLLLLIVSCDSPVGNNPTRKSTIPQAKVQVAPPKISYSNQPIKPDTARKSIFQQFKAKNGKGWRIRWNKHTGLPASLFLGHTKKIYRGPAEEAARSFLADHVSLLGFGALKHLKYVKTKTYKGMRYVTFNETVKGVPVYEAQYVVHLTPKGQVNMVNGAYYPSINISTSPSVAASQALSAARADLKNAAGEDLQTKSKLVIWHSKQQFHLAWKLELSSQKAFTDWLYLVDAHSGNILNKLNLVHTYTGSNAPYLAAPAPRHWVSKLLVNVLTGDGNVYPTYPLSSSVTDEPLHRLNSSGYLTGTHAKIVNDKASRAFSETESFQYVASNTHFDEVNLYYHIDKFRSEFVNQYDPQAGFDQVTAHAHSSQVDANAKFLAPNTLIFGDASNHPSFNDFAKSDQVIYHEYGHDVIYHINSNIVSSFTTEEGAISEGTPDYFAGTFTTRSINGDYVLAGNHPDILRDMANPTFTNYSQLLDANDNYNVYDPHLGGEFFSSILWDIRSKIGAEKTNSVVFAALHGISGGPTFLEFRDAMMSADYNDYGGTDVDNIQNTFADKGVGTPVQPPALQIVITSIPASVYQGDLVTVKTKTTNGTPPYSFQYDYHYHNSPPLAAQSNLSPAQNSPNTDTQTFIFQVPCDSGPSYSQLMEFDVTVTDANGETASASRGFVVYPAPCEN